jgi:hypothetical protein
VSTALSEFKRSLGGGRFTLVIAGFGNTTAGAYNLYIDAPAAGCSISLAPTAAGATISGRVLTNEGYGIGGATVSLSGGDFSQQLRARTNPFGYYTFENIPVGLTYILTVGSKQHINSHPTSSHNNRAAAFYGKPTGGCGKRPNDGWDEHRRCLGV